MNVQLNIQIEIYLRKKIEGRSLMTQDDFAAYFKTITATDLLSILEYPDRYQLQAVEAARKELNARALSEEALQLAMAPIIANKWQQEKQEKKRKVMETTLRNAGHTFIETINPVQNGISSTEKSIRLILVVFMGLFLYSFIIDFKWHRALIGDFQLFPSLVIITLLPVLLLPVSLFLFWKRTRTGWILLATYLLFSLSMSLWNLSRTITWKPYGIASLDNTFQRPSPINAFLVVIFFGGMTYALLSKNIRSAFLVESKEMLGAAVISLLMIVISFVVLTYN
jgi:hypothetical protein